MTKNVLIIGSGKLGLPLATNLAQQGFNVTTTTTTSNKVSSTVCPNPNIVYWRSQTEESINQEQCIPSFSFASNHFDMMIITIPPKRQQNNYFHQLMALHHLALSLNIKKLLFISSTSVWGENSGIVNEQTIKKPASDSAIAMVEFEILINSEPNYQGSAIKLAGLIGGTRQPGRFLANKQDLAMAKAPINLVTQRDVIGIINAIIKQDIWQPSFIACAPTHPQRDEFYTLAANKLNLTPPTFSCIDNDIAKNSKVIDASLTAKQLNYQYQDDNLIDWLHCAL